MSKLKTLEDLDTYGVDADGVLDKSLVGDCIKEEDLKQEAIKWIKEISKGGFDKKPKVTIENMGEVASKALIQAETDLVVRWIKHFFNITEEDLKNG